MWVKLNSLNRKSLLLATLMLVLSLGSHGLGGQSLAGAKETGHRQKALERAAARANLPIDDLTIVHEAATSFAQLGKQAVRYKTYSRSTGQIVEVTLSPEGQELDGEALFADELAAQRTAYGKLSPRLHQGVQSVVADELIPVSIWLKLSDELTPQRPFQSGLSGNTPAMPLEQQEQIVRAWEARRAEAIRPVSQGALKKLARLGATGQAELHSPILLANLSPKAIKQVETWAEVDSLSLVEGAAKDKLDTARYAIRADHPHTMGNTGQGVKVGVIEASSIAVTTNPYLQGFTQPQANKCYGSHATGVAGVIGSSASINRGIAPGASLWIGSPCGGIPTSNMAPFAQQAMDWGAYILNFSWGDISSGSLFQTDKYYDDIVINRYRTIAVSSGNNGYSERFYRCDWDAPEGNHYVNSPATAYNVIAVGSYDNKNTTWWTDDIMDRCSSWEDPLSTNNDRQKPELVAPGENITTVNSKSAWVDYTDSGTSFAAPMVAGTAALMLKANPNLTAWPEAVKSILMASAIHNIEGDARLSEFDGAGGIDATGATDVARGYRGGWNAQGYSCSTGTVDHTVALYPSNTVRVAIAWDNNPIYAGYFQRPSADLDLVIVAPNGSHVISSTSFDNNYEIVQFTPPVSGNYIIRVSKYRCDETPRWLGVAWHTF